MTNSPARRTVYCEDALGWLERAGTLQDCSLITSLPDYSEFPALTLAQWRDWFTGAAERVLRACPDEGVTVFFQTDLKKNGEWIDKAHLCQLAARNAGHALLWHKIVCRVPAGSVTYGRPAYSHLLCFSRGQRAEIARSTADVITDPGPSTWTRGMGTRVCLAVCRFVLEHTATRTIVDPFCGHGTVLAAANALGLDAVGVDLGPKRARRARVLRIAPDGTLDLKPKDPMATRILPLSTILAGLLLLLAGTVPPRRVQAQDTAADAAWVQLGEEDGITVYRKKVPGDPVFAYKGVGTLDAPLGKIITISRDTPRHTEWVNRLEVAKVIRELTPYDRIIYMKVDSPWPVSDRDFVVESKFTVDRQKRTASFDMHSVTDPLAPPDDCCVRAEVHSNHVDLRDAGNGRTWISAEAHVDPRGSLPSWLVNFVQRTFPRKSVEGLLKQATKPDIQDFFLTQP
jgi:hypothetical protein